jgi:hypothetical protein
MAARKEVHRANCIDPRAQGMYQTSHGMLVVQGGSACLPMRGAHLCKCGSTHHV